MGRLRSGTQLAQEAQQAEPWEVQTVRRKAHRALQGAASPTHMKGAAYTKLTQEGEAV